MPSPASKTGPAAHLAPRPRSGPPLSPSSFATDRFGAFLDSNLEREFWCWLNPQAVKTDATTLLMLGRRRRRWTRALWRPGRALKSTTTLTTRR